MIFTPQAIRERLRDRPFKPVRIKTSAGAEHDVNHPDLAIVGLNDVTIGIPAANQPEYYERVTRIAIAHITEMQDLAMPVSAVATADAE